jgi:hypothetical protein
MGRDLIGLKRNPAPGGALPEAGRKGGTLADRKNTMDERRMTSQETG